MSGGFNTTLLSDSRDGRLGNTAVPPQRYKEDIKPIDKASEALFALKPVSFRYKKRSIPRKALDFGLIAEEVAKVAPDLVYRNDKGESRKRALRGGERDVAQ